MAIVYHITRNSQWTEAQAKGTYITDSLAEEGFIHCSQENQIKGVLERYFSGEEHLIRLSIDSSKLDSPLIYDWSPSLEDTFPHIYGPINLEAVVGTLQLVP
jgi:uncharacterized protein (DUF952 family)